MFATLLGAFSTLLYALDRDIISVSDVPILYVDSPFITCLRNPRDPLQVYVHSCLQATRLCFRSMWQGTGRNVPNSPYRRSCGKSAVSPTPMQVLHPLSQNHSPTSCVFVAPSLVV